MDKDIILLDLEDIDTKPHIPVVHNPMVIVTPSKAMTVLESEICELYSIAKSTAAIAESLGISTSTVRTTLAKPHIKDFVAQLVNAQYLTHLEGRLRILNKIIDDKIERIEGEFDGDFSQATKKDIVDLMVVSDTLQKERTKKELGLSDNIYVQILNQITD